MLVELSWLMPVDPALVSGTGKVFADFNSTLHCTLPFKSLGYIILTQFILHGCLLVDEPIFKS